MDEALINGQIFTGENLLADHAVIIDGGSIAAIQPQSQLPAHISTTHDLKGATLVPGFIDLQVNGGGGVMLNNAPTVDTIRRIGAAHSRYGTTGFLPTLITDSFEIMREAIAAVSQAIEERVPGVLGIHLEGPFLCEEKKGAHDAKKFCPIDEQGLDIISSLNRGKTLITIAPELTTTEMIGRIVERGVIICAGHSGADYDQTRAALAAGVSGFTHLYNAMTPLLSRNPGMVGAALADEHSWFSIIADGYHMHPVAFKVAVAAKQRGGAILVTDAMATVGMDESAKGKSFVLNGQTIWEEHGRLSNAAGTLAGSDLDMLSAVKNAVEFAGIDWLEAVRMASLYPARALGLDHRLGYIKPGFRANFIALDAQMDITHSWIDGCIQ